MQVADMFQYTLVNFGTGSYVKNLKLRKKNKVALIWLLSIQAFQAFKFQLIVILKRALFFMGIFCCLAPMVLASHENISEGTKVAGSAKSIKNSVLVADYVDFYGLKESLDGPPISRGIIRSWSTREEGIVREIFEKICNEVPGLLQGAGYKQKIVLVRVANSSIIASANSNRIVIGDLFFKDTITERRFHYIFHELVHVCDTGCVISYSPQWTGFALEKTKTIRRIAALLTTSGRAEFNNYLKTHETLPNIYASENLREALAEYVSTGFENKNYQFNPDFIKHIVSPTYAESETHLRLVKAINLSWSGDANLAIEFCKAAKSYNPGTPVVDCLLAYNLSRLGRLQECIAACEIADKKFLALGIDSREFWCRENLQLLGNTLLKLKEPLRARQIFSQILIYAPNDSEALMSRSRCSELLKLWSSASQDRYRASGYLMQCSALTLISEDPMLAQAFLKKFACNFSKDIARFRPSLLVLSANTTRDRNLRLSNLKDAVLEYKAILEQDSYRDVSLLVKLVWLNLELDDACQARKYLNLTLELQPSFIPAQIAEIAVLEREKKKAEAYSRYLSIIKIICRLPQSQEESPETEFKVRDWKELLDFENCARTGE